MTGFPPNEAQQANRAKEGAGGSENPFTLRENTHVLRFLLADKVKLGSQGWKFILPRSFTLR